MHFALIFSSRVRTKLLAQLTLFEDVEETEEEEFTVDKLETGFRAAVQSSPTVGGSVVE